MPKEGDDYSDIQIDHSFDLELPGKCGVLVEREDGSVRIVIHDNDLTIGLEFSAVSALNMARMLMTSGELARRWLRDRALGN